LYTNAGHNPPMFFTDKNEPVLLKSGGPVVGFMDGIEFNDDTILFEPGNLCVIYSDGITEAMDKSENEFGEDKLKALVKKNRDLSSAELIEKILKAVDEHSKNVPQSDDITIVVIRKT
jgi:sigma-B regulation protein RsbU (phosphoserine phosphatase)